MFPLIWVHLYKIHSVCKKDKMSNTIMGDYYQPMERKSPKGERLHPEIGTTVHEGEGRFTQSVAGKIWRGTGSLDLQLEPENIASGKGLGAYSDEAREKLVENDELTPLEEAFMMGWEQAEDEEEEENDL